MPRQVFYSFHYANDAARAAQIRNIGAIFGNQPASDNDWETVKKGGDAAIQRWIDGQMNGTSCTIVLIGAQTAGRKWIDYEIRKAWNDKKGLFGIHIHNLRPFNVPASPKGANPFGQIAMTDGARMSAYVDVYDPAGLTSADVYNTISYNLETWIEKAVRARR